MYLELGLLSSLHWSSETIEFCYPPINWKTNTIATIECLQSTKGNKQNHEALLFHSTQMSINSTSILFVSNLRVLQLDSTLSRIGIGPLFLFNLLALARVQLPTSEAENSQRQHCHQIDAVIPKERPALLLAVQESASTSNVTHNHVHQDQDQH